MAKQERSWRALRCLAMAEDRASRRCAKMEPDHPTPLQNAHLLGEAERLEKRLADIANVNLDSWLEGYNAGQWRAKGVRWPTRA